MSKTISFHYRCNLQARFVRMKSRATGQPEISIALKYAEALARKIDSKYQTYQAISLRRV